MKLPYGYISIPFGKNITMVKGFLLFSKLLSMKEIFLKSLLRGQRQYELKTEKFG